MQNITLGLHRFFANDLCLTILLGQIILYTSLQNLLGEFGLNFSFPQFDGFLVQFGLEASDGVLLSLAKCRELLNILLVSLELFFHISLLNYFMQKKRKNKN